MSGGFECDGDGRYELVRDGIAVLCNTAPLAVDAGNPNPSIFHPPSSILHPPSSILHPPSSIFHPPSSIPYISYSAFVQPRHLGQPTGPPLSLPLLLPLLLLLAAPPFDLPLQLLPGPTLVPPLRLYLRGSGGGWVGVR